MAIFGKKPAPSSGPSDIPIDKIIQLRKQGLSNNQIIQNLQRDGYTVQQVFDGMNQAEAMEAVKGPEPMYKGDVENPVEMKAGSPVEPGMPPMNASQGPPMPPAQGQPGPMPGPMPGMQVPVQNDRRVEEIAEAIIDEKWEEIEKGMQRVVEWKDNIDQRMTKQEQQMADFSKTLNELQKAILEKVAEYDVHIKDVGTELKAMEKVFSQILPKFTENVHELSRVTGLVKKNKAKK